MEAELMQGSRAGYIDIISREGICLDWYYDSVSVPTWGIGETHYDGIDPRVRGSASLPIVINSFIKKISSYEAAINRLARTFTQTQFDALLSFDYNCGERNLDTLCHHRDAEQIGAAIMYYLKPPEIKTRRMGEQALYIRGAYTCKTGEVLVFPVSKNRRPDYHHGKLVDIRSFFGDVK